MKRYKRRGKERKGQSEGTIERRMPSPFLLFSVSCRFAKYCVERARANEKKEKARRGK